MAQGKVFSGGTPLILSDENVKIYKDGAWSGAKTMNYWNGSAWVDILYHAPSVPAAGTVLSGSMGGGYVKNYLVNNMNCPFEPGTLLRTSGYDLEATLASGRRCLLSFTRGLVYNQSWWFSIGLYRAGSYSAGPDPNNIYGGNTFSYNIPCSVLDAAFGLAWISAPDGGGGTGRELDVSGFTFTML